VSADAVCCFHVALCSIAEVNIQLRSQRYTVQGQIISPTVMFNIVISKIFEIKYTET
jgi:hypothetical protein